MSCRCQHHRKSRWERGALTQALNYSSDSLQSGSPPPLSPSLFPSLNHSSKAATTLAAHTRGGTKNAPVSRGISLMRASTELANMTTETPQLALAMRFLSEDSEMPKRAAPIAREKQLVKRALPVVERKRISKATTRIQPQCAGFSARVMRNIEKNRTTSGGVLENRRQHGDTSTWETETERE
eukprot:3838924-Rhodomonas_salina.1